MGPRIKIQNSSEKSERFSRINKWNQIETCAKRSRRLVLKQGVVGWMDGWMAEETWELLWSEHGPGDLSGTQGCTHGMGKARAGW